MRASPLAILPLAFVLSLPAVTTRFYAADEIQYFVYLRSLRFDGDVSFDNEYRYFYDRGVAQGTRPRADGTGYYGEGFHRTFLEATTATGLRLNYAPVGCALLWAPFYLAADMGVRVARGLGSTTPADGLSYPYIAAATYASAFYGFLALVLSVVAVRRILGAADWTFAAVWLGTPLVFYMYVAPGFSHATSAFAVAAFLVAWLRVRRTWSLAGVALLGALAAVMGMVREQDVLVAIGPAVDFGRSAIGSVRRGTRRPVDWLLKAGVGAMSLALCLLPQLLAYAALHGRPAPPASTGERMAWASPFAWQVIASPDYGLVFWSPLVVLAVAGLVWLGLGRVPQPDFDRARDPDADRAWIGWMCLLMCASQIYASGSVVSWMGGAFGQRRLVGLTVFFVIGLAALVRSVRRPPFRLALATAIGLLTWWHLGLAAQYGTGMMSRRQLEPAVNAYHNFVTIPRMLPSLAYRYVFDRESFYQKRPPASP